MQSAHCFFRLSVQWLVVWSVGLLVDPSHFFVTFSATINLTRELITWSETKIQTKRSRLFSAVLMKSTNYFFGTPVTQEIWLSSHIDNRSADPNREMQNFFYYHFMSENWTGLGNGCFTPVACKCSNYVWLMYGYGYGYGYGRCAICAYCWMDWRTVEEASQ